MNPRYFLAYSLIVLKMTKEQRVKYQFIEKRKRLNHFLTFLLLFSLFFIFVAFFVNLFLLFLVFPHNSFVVI